MHHDLLIKVGKLTSECGGKHTRSGLSNSYFVDFVSEIQISNRGHFFLLCDLFLLSNLFAFYFLIEMARTSGTMLTKSGDTNKSPGPDGSQLHSTKNLEKS